MWALSCSKRDSLVDVVGDVVQERSEDVHEDVPFRDILMLVWGLPVQLYRDVNASDRDKVDSTGTCTIGHQEKKWANPRRNLQNQMIIIS